VDRVKSGMRFGLFGLFYQDLGSNLKGQYFASFHKKKETKLGENNQKLAVLYELTSFV